MLLHVATRKGLFVYDLAPAVPAVVGRHFLGDNVSLTLADMRSGRWYAALDHGHFGVKVQGSADGGSTWQELPAPVYPPRPEGAPEVGADGRPLAWSLKRIWALETGGPAQPGRLWCGTIPGGLFRSDDHGASWQLVEGLWRHPDRTKWFGGGADHPGIHSICVDPRDPAVVRVAVSCGGVWTTRDAGATWTNTSRGLFAVFMPPEQRENPNIQDVHRLVQCQHEPQRLWLQHHNGIFRSDDGAQSWRHCPDVPPSGIGFGFAVAVDPMAGDTAWFVPAIKDEHRIPVDGKVVVTRTRDGGRSWQVLRDGLPQQDAYDLTYRHGLDVAPDGRTLAFGSTTGDLWISRDGGDRWQAVNVHLPPIHAVRLVPAHG
jgi:photosystem II stability/assembly factor-like uncharacterized protein